MKIKKNIALSESGFLFNTSTGESFSVNPIGGDILKLLKESNGKDEIKDIILNKYNTDEVTFERDFFDFVSLLNHYHFTEPDG